MMPGTLMSGMARRRQAPSLGATVQTVGNRGYPKKMSVSTVGKRYRKAGVQSGHGTIRSNQVRCSGLTDILKRQRGYTATVPVS